MHLTEYDLKQLDDERLVQLSPEQLVPLSLHMLHDLKELWDRVNQTPSNSSKPPSSRAPWETAANAGPDAGNTTTTESINLEPPAAKQTDTSEASAVEIDGASSVQASSDALTTAEALIPVEDGRSRSPSNTPTGRKAGKQKGAKGYGRTQKLPIDTIIAHYPQYCALCGAELPVNIARAYTATDTIDLDPNKPLALVLTTTRHVLYETICSCGHMTRACLHRAKDDSLWNETDLGEWRLIGPHLAATIVVLALRMRLSRARIQEFFAVFFGLNLSIGVLDKTVREAGRAVQGLEVTLTTIIVQSPLLCIDETPWKEKGQPYYLWAFITPFTTFFFMGKRTIEALSTIVSENFTGEVMSDGYMAYRHFDHRLRCWAHLMRKLQGLADSYTTRVASVGQTMLVCLHSLMQAIYQARRNTTAPIPAQQCATELAQLRTLCENHQDDKHDKLREVSREFLNDWSVIMRQVYEPQQPLTNNAAEQALRHWVMVRRISQGTRSKNGTHALTLLASVIETCRRRKACVWRYLSSVISAARQGLTLPDLPPIPTLGV